MDTVCQRTVIVVQYPLTPCTPSSPSRPHPLYTLLTPPPSYSDLLKEMAGLMNEMACNKINEAQAVCGEAGARGDATSSDAVIAALRSERSRLELAAYIFQVWWGRGGVAFLRLDLCNI